MRPTLSFLLLFFTTIYICAQDTTPPILSSVAFSQSSVNAGETISVIVEAHDEMSPLDTILVRIKSPNDEQEIIANDPLSSWTSLGNDRYRQDLTVNAYAVGGNWHVSLVQLRDNANNYLDNAYTSDNPPYTFEVEEALSIENHKQQKLTVYPNPSESFIHINADFSSAKIYDLHGKLQFVFHSKTADVSALDKGFYILELFDDKKNKMATFKFIKK